MSCSQRVLRSRGRYVPQCLAQGAFKLVYNLVQLGHAGIVGWRQDNGVARNSINVSAHRVADEAIFERSRADSLMKTECRRERHLARTICDKLEADEKAATAHVSK